MADEQDDGLGEDSTSKASVGDIFGVSSGKRKKKKKKATVSEAAPESASDGLDTPSSAADDAVAALEADLLGDDVPGDDEATRVVDKASLKKKASKSDADDEERDEAPAPKKVAKAKKADDADEKPAPKPAPKKAAAKAKKADVADEEPAPKPKKAKKPKNSAAALDGVLRPSTDDAPDDYLNAADLGDYDAPPKTFPWKVVAAVGVVLAVALGGLFALGDASDIAALFQGTLREKRIAEARMLEEQHLAEQLAKQEIYGNLMISGSPKYALVKINGQLQYGQTSQGWREVRIGTTPGIQNMRVKATHVVEVSAPGYEPTTIEVTEGRWDAGAIGHAFAVNPSLAPSSVHAKQEFDARMGQDLENEFFGKVTINSTPPGANIIWGNKELLDEKGEQIVTPATFDKYWTKTEDGKLEENLVRVDTTLDVGHKIEVVMAYDSTCPEGEQPACGVVDNCCPNDCNVALDSDCKWPKYITSLMRPMWTCTWNTKDGAPPEKIPADKTIQHFCDYSYQLDVDLNGLKSFIVAQEEARKKALEQEEADGVAPAETASAQ